MTDEKKDVMRMGERGLALTSFDELQRFAACVVDSFKTGVPCVPVAYKSLPQVVMAIQAGRELGFPPMQALSSLYPLDGRFSLYAEAASALAVGSGEITAMTVKWRKTINGKAEEFDEPPSDMTLEDMEKTNLACCIEVKTKLGVRKFVYSVLDARTAGLWKRTADSGKKMTWWFHPKDMLYNRCLSRALHSSVPHIIKGVKIEGDIESVKEVEAQTETIQAGPAIEEPETFDGTVVDITAPAPPSPFKPKEQEPEQETPPPPVDDFEVGLFEETPDTQAVEITDSDAIVALSEKVVAANLGASVEKVISWAAKKCGLADVKSKTNAKKVREFLEDWAAKKGVK